MQFYDDLWCVNQRAHALAALWCLLCEDGTEPQGRLHAASLRDFLQVLRTERQEMDNHLDALTRTVERAVALLDASGSPEHPHTYIALCRFLALFDPYLDRYPALSATEAYHLFRDNTLQHFYPVEESRRSL